MEYEERYITPTHVRDYLFCPSTFYYKYVIGIKEPMTELMQEGIVEFARDQRKFEERKTLLNQKRIRVDKMLFGIMVTSRKYGIMGVVDTLYWSNNKLNILEIKASRSTRLYPNHLYQTSVYALAVEENFGQPVYKVAIFYKRSGAWFERRFTRQLRDYSIRLVERIRLIMDHGEIPEPGQSHKCKSCFYNRFCHG